jgi:hypothetical protein
VPIKGNLLAVLIEQLPHLSSFIRVSVTSREEFDIKRAAESQPIFTAGNSTLLMLLVGFRLVITDLLFFIVD